MIARLAEYLLGEGVLFRLIDLAAVLAALYLTLRWVDRLPLLKRLFDRVVVPVLYVLAIGLPVGAIVASIVLSVRAW